ncbi:MAG: 1-acyl-sn-glycerol-3-phosphate acyltransferase [Deltaproteobacteria bacterium]|nr:1-acyl-sn-glycerol-3-phosphate acyltransferase [Deltaproteobacteria bacterium]
MTHPLLRLARWGRLADLRYALPHVFAGRVLALARETHDELGPTPLDQRDPEYVGAVVEAVRHLFRHWFRPRLEGLENLPAKGPALLAGNHNGGLQTFDALLVFQAVWDRFGPERRVYGMGHDAIQWEPLLRRYLAPLGVLRAAHGDAERAFEAGHLVLVYPGSDYDSFRPFWERQRVVLAGRTGFVRLALRARVPVVPVVGAGGQEQLIGLTRGEALAKALDLPRRLRTKAFPLAVTVPWGLTSAWLPYLPLPAQLTVSFLPALRWDRLPAGSERDPEAVQACYREFESVMQAELTRLYRGRIPWLGRPEDRAHGR